MNPIFAYIITVAVCSIIFTVLLTIFIYCGLEEDWGDWD